MVMVNDWTGVSKGLRNGINFAKLLQNCSKCELKASGGFLFHLLALLTICMFKDNEGKEEKEQQGSPI